LGGNLANGENSFRIPNSEFRNSDRALIFNIQRFSIHDGPGIRTTVFFKGCPLRCDWCSNPESMEPFPQLMVRDMKCTACGKCAEACPREAISRTADGTREFHWDECDHCFRCVDACLYGALTEMGRFIGLEELIGEVEKDLLFYKNSGGGVTLSGGEPLAQYPFVLHFLRELKERGFHTALDTSGWAPESVWSAVLPYADLVLFDIKQLNEEKHRARTGVPNRQILANARLAASKARTWFRLPLIQGFNDDPEDLRVLADMAKEMGVEKVSFLPYHEGGVTKRLQIGQEPSPLATRPPSDEHLQKIKKIVEETGVAVSVGN
jgi:pyruvate formate lyase activating enzyme